MDLNEKIAAQTKAVFDATFPNANRGCDGWSRLVEVISPPTAGGYPLSGGESTAGTRSAGVEGSIPSQSTFKFQKTLCSSCGREFGPGNHGFSHCEDHA